MTGTIGPDGPALYPVEAPSAPDPVGAAAPDPMLANREPVDLGPAHPGPDPYAESESEPEPEPRDWAWVEEWREGGEPMPWGPGLAVAGFTAFLVASAVYVLCSGLSSRPLVAIAVNVVVVAGLCPALWLSRGLPVLRWVAGGAAAGVLAAWLCVLVFLT